MLTIEWSVPLLEGWELAVKDDELPLFPVTLSLDHHHHMGITRFGFAIAACLVLIGCGVGIIRRHFGCFEQHTAPLKRKRPVNQNLLSVGLNH